MFSSSISTTNSASRKCVPSAAFFCCSWLSQTAFWLEANHPLTPKPDDRHQTTTPKTRSSQTEAKRGMQYSIYEIRQQQGIELHLYSADNKTFMMLMKVDSYKVLVKKFPFVCSSLIPHSSFCASPSITAYALFCSWIGLSCSFSVGYAVDGPVPWDQQMSI